MGHGRILASPLVHQGASLPLHAKTSVTSLALTLATLFFVALVVVFARLPAPERKDVEAHIANRSGQVTAYRAILYPVTDELSEGKISLWSAARILHEHCESDYPEMFAVVAADVKLGNGDTLSKFARSLIGTYRVRETPADWWPGNYPEWIVDRLEWEFANREMFEPY